MCFSNPEYDPSELSLTIKYLHLPSSYKNLASFHNLLLLNIVSHALFKATCLGPHDDRNQTFDHFLHPPTSVFDFFPSHHCFLVRSIDPGSSCLLIYLKYLLNRRLTSGREYTPQKYSILECKTCAFSLR